ncbi:hypothetical protein CS063_09925 [Sporanaerobium hydrogeniformans]|uniref:Uncharacterized protein n=1 Tax=Sporanaerobium hydrogeniformans TaxID=3072179 RepID=A0AC61DCI4_9FIRM|nr:DUF4446 family protein [Sporanaerobium hydrogeniformans]PHV70610.1 hypothetical protein CS063_09925 [Sporanaerobium hydrogeniformans]
MQQIMEILNSNILYIVAGLALAIVIMFIMLITYMVKLKKIQHRYEKFMSKEEVDLEELLVQYTKKLNILLQNEKEMMDTIKKIEEDMKFCIKKVGVVRYNAIAHMGADLSFAIALLDSKNNGFVLNGIYSRDGSYTYAKPLQDGKSTYNLSDEEKEAINKALNQKSM